MREQDHGTHLIRKWKPIRAVRACALRSMHVATRVNQLHFASLAVCLIHLSAPPHPVVCRCAPCPPPAQPPMSHSNHPPHPFAIYPTLRPTRTLCFLPVFCWVFPPGIQTQGFFPKPMKGHHGFKFHPYWPSASYHFHMYLPHPIATATRYAPCIRPMLRSMVPRACTACPKCIPNCTFHCAMACWGVLPWAPCLALLRPTAYVTLCYEYYWLCMNRTFMVYTMYHKSSNVP